MMFVLISIISGFVIALRTWKSWIVDGIFDFRQARNFAVVAVFTVFIAGIVFPGSYLVLWSATFVPIPVWGGLSFWIRRRRQEQFRTQLSGFIDRTALLVSTGIPFRQSLEQSAAQSAPSFRRQMIQVLEVVFFSEKRQEQSQTPGLHELVEEIRRIDRSGQKTLQNLRSFRRKLRIEDEFRKKSGIALARLRSQSALLGVFYFALGCYVIKSFGWKSSLFWLGISSFFFVTGLIWINLGGRRHRWKV